MDNEVYVFFIFILNGFLIGIIFDVFRILRKAFKTKDVITYLQDFLFWILSGAIVLYTIFKFNNGILRGFIFVGILIGFIIYILAFSKVFINTNLFIINIIKKILYYVLIIPLRTIYKLLIKILFNPLNCFFKKITQIVSNLKIKVIFYHKKHKKTQT